MKKFLLYLIPILALASFIIVMNSGSFLKRSFGEDDRLHETVEEIEQNVINEKWELAEQNIEYTEKAWKKIVNRIQFSVEKEFIIEISSVLARIKGGIQVKDDQEVIEDVYVFYKLWNELAR